MSSTLSLFIEAYEQANGKKPDESSMRFLEHMDRVGQVYRVRGQKDAAQGCEPYSKEVFAEAAMKRYREDPEWAQLVTDVAYGYYIDGYEGDSA